MLLAGLITLLALATLGRADEDLFRRQTHEACPSVTHDCPKSATFFCSRYLGYRPDHTGTLITTYTTTAYATRTISTSTSSCPSKAAGNKPSAATPLAEHNPTGLDKRAAESIRPPPPTPSCLSPYTTAASKLSSACKCFSITTKTHTRTYYTPASSVTTVTVTQATQTLTVLTATPTCKVSYTDPTSGNKTNWSEYLGVCRATKLNYNTVYQNSLNTSLTLCGALNECAEQTATRDGETFELARSDFPYKPRGWFCRGFQGGPGTYDYFQSHSYISTYEYQIEGGKGSN